MLRLKELMNPTHRENPPKKEAKDKQRFNRSGTSMPICQRVKQYNDFMSAGTT